MFEEPRNLLVVYKSKDEISLNQLKKFVDTKDDDSENEKIVGTEDGTVKIIAWDEKTWTDNKKAGNSGHLDDKILFLGDIKGVEKLIPTLDIKFDEFGVSYGFSGKQAVIIVDSKPLNNPETYDSFMKKLNEVCDALTAKEKKYFDTRDLKDVAKKGAKYFYLATAFFLPAVVGTVNHGVKDAKLVRDQQLLYGISMLYLNDLDAFMKS